MHEFMGYQVLAVGDDCFIDVEPWKVKFAIDLVVASSSMIKVVERDLPSESGSLMIVH